MSVIHERIKANFNKAAHTYDESTYLQQKIGEALIHMLPKRLYSKIIDLGCGTGFTTERLAKTLLFHEFDAVDSASSMVNFAKAQYLNSCVHYQVGDFNQSLKHHYDLIYSNMALHWSEDLKKTLILLLRGLCKDGILAFSLPLTGTFRELEPDFNIRSFFSSDKVFQIVRSQGFVFLKENSIETQVYFDSTLDGLRTLKLTGVTTTNHRPRDYPRAIIRKNQLKQLTYQIGLFVIENE